MATTQVSADGVVSNRMSDTKRIQRILDEMGGRTTDNKSRPFAVVDDKAKIMLMEYAIELTSSLIETSNALAKHRSSSTIDADDVNLILAKKLGLDIPGQPRIKSLYQQNLKSMYTPGSKSSSSATTITPAQQAAAVAVNSLKVSVSSNSSHIHGDKKQGQGLKRKMNADQSV